MNFVKKSLEEISKMSAEEKEQYFTAKEAHDNEVRKQELKEATDKAVQAAKEAVTEALKEKPEGITNEAFEQFKTEMNEQLKNLEKVAGKSDNPEGAVNVIKEAAKLYEAYYEGGEVVTDNAVKTFGSKAKFTIADKAWNATDVHTVGTAGTQVPDSTYQTMVAQVIGRYTAPRAVSKIMDFVNVVPLDSNQLVIFEDKAIGSFVVTAENAIKPFIRYEESDKSADANIATALWLTSAKLRRFYPGVANKMRATFEVLLGETIPSLVLTYVKANSVAFTPNANLVWAAPTMFEAIVSVIASLKKMARVPNAFALSPIGYAKLVTQSANGIYTLQNGSSITLVGDRIKFGGYDIAITEDPTLLDDEFIIGDLSNVHVGLDSQTLYLETDGRIDGETTVKTGLAVNVRTHELGKFVGMLIADGAKAGIVKDTFTNVITLITEDAG